MSLQRPQARSGERLVRGFRNLTPPRLKGRGSRQTYRGIGNPSFPGSWYREPLRLGKDTLALRGIRDRTARGIEAPCFVVTGTGSRGIENHRRGLGLERTYKFAPTGQLNCLTLCLTESSLTKTPPLGGYAPAGSRPQAVPAAFGVLPPGIPQKPVSPRGTTTHHSAIITNVSRQPSRRFSFPRKLLFLTLALRTRSVGCTVGEGVLDYRAAGLERGAPDGNDPMAVSPSCDPSSEPGST